MAILDTARERRSYNLRLAARLQCNLLSRPSVKCTMPPKTKGKKGKKGDDEDLWWVSSVMMTFVVTLLIRQGGQGGGSGGEITREWGR